MSKTKKKQVDEDLEDDDLDNEEDEQEESSELEDEDDDKSEDLSDKGKGKSKDKPKKKEKGDEESEDEEDEEEAEESEEDSQAFLPKGFKVPKELQAAYKQMQSGFNKKLTTLDKQYKGKKVIGGYDELLKDNDFLSWAEGAIGKAGTSGDVDLSQFSMDEIVQSWGKLPQGKKRVYWGALKPEAQELFKVKLQLQGISQSTYASKEANLEGEVVKKYTNYGDYKDEVKKLRMDIARNPYMHHDEAFKILDYDAFGKRMHKLGLLEGRKGVKKSKEEFVEAEPGKGVKGKKKKAQTIKEAWDQAEEDEE